MTVERKIALPDNPKWQARALESIQPQALEQIQRVRDTVASLGQQQVWYYGGAMHDVTPLIFAPPGTHHWFVDGDYYTNQMLRNLIVDQITDPLLKAGTSITAHSFAEGNGTNGVIDFDQGQIVLNTSDVHIDHPMPDTVDVVYANSTLPRVILASLERLRVGGMYVVSEDRELELSNHPFYIENTYGPNGLLLQPGSVFQTILHTDPFIMDIPAFGELGVTTEHRTQRIRVMIKNQDLTEDIKDVLKAREGMPQAE